MTESAPDLSIIIPAYNEEQRLPGTLEKIAAFLQNEPTSAEVVVVDDGSSDNTVVVAESFRGKLPQLRVISNGTNRGKGYSVRNGSLQARGQS